MLALLCSACASKAPDLRGGQRVDAGHAYAMAGSDGGGPTIIGLTVQVEEDPGAALAALAAVSGKAAAGEDYAPPPDGGVHGSAATGVAMAVRDAEEAYEEEEKAAAARA